MLCILSAGKTITLATSFFTLSWTHSIERTRWEEHWRVMPSGLQVVEARIKGSGAGMEPPEGAVLEDGWWIYRPAIGPQAKLRLAASGATKSAWTLCAPQACIDLGADADEPLTLSSCASGEEPPSSGVSQPR